MSFDDPLLESELEFPSYPHHPHVWLWGESEARRESVTRVHPPVLLRPQLLELGDYIHKLLPAPYTAEQGSEKSFERRRCSRTEGTP